MQNEPMGHIKPSDVNNSIQRGADFSSFRFLRQCNKSCNGYLWTTSCTSLCREPSFFYSFILKTTNHNPMKEQVTIAYEAPKVEIIEVQVEKGFALSGQGLDSDDSEFSY